MKIDNERLIDEIGSYSISKYLAARNNDLESYDKLDTGLKHIKKIAIDKLNAYDALQARLAEAEECIRFYADAPLVADRIDLEKHGYIGLRTPAQDYLGKYVERIK